MLCYRVGNFYLTGLIITCTFIIVEASQIIYPEKDCKVQKELKVLSDPGPGRKPYQPDRLVGHPNLPLPCLLPPELPWSRKLNDSPTV